jgi:hypothetical protein
VSVWLGDTVCVPLAACVLEGEPDCDTVSACDGVAPWLTLGVCVPVAAPDAVLDCVPVAALLPVPVPLTAWDAEALWLLVADCVAVGADDRDCV